MKRIIGKWVIIVAAGLFFLSHAEVWGEDWKFIRKQKNGDSSYYDADNITRPSKGMVRGVVKIVYSEKSINREVEKLGSSFKDLSHRTVIWEMNCSEKKVAFHQTDYYSKKGTIIKSIKIDKVTWMTIAPDTMGEDLFKILCK
ncbi:MAG: hypothetical protein HXY44_06020 [Syntrophaceae bacterium]|nr:hypothetical protein [Syntrophaceae bacterium]